MGRRYRLIGIGAALALTGAVLAAGPASATITDTFTGSLSASGTSWASHTFKVLDTTGPIQATLDWSDASANFNLFLYDPSGTNVASAISTTNKPEVITFSPSVTGTWKIGIKAKTGQSSYTVVVTHSPGSSPPSADAVYGTTLGYSGPAGVYAYGVEWDEFSNTILVGDVWNYRVQRFTATGGIPAGCADPCVVSTKADRGKLGGIGSPFDVEVDPDGNYWVADQADSRVVEFTPGGQWVQSIGLGGGPNAWENYGQGCGGGKMTWPTHLVFSPNGNLFVSDPSCGDVYVFDSQGHYLHDFAFNLGPCCGINIPIPRGIGRTSDGHVYVVEHRSRSVVVFNDAGTQLSVWPKRSDMQDPRGLDVDEAHGFLYVVDAYDDEIFKYSLATGQVLAKWSSWGSTPFNTIRFVTVDGSGNVYVGETWGYQVRKLDMNGNPLPWATGPQPPPDGGLNQNNGIGVDPTGGGHFYSIDSFENRVQRWRITNGTGNLDHCLGPNNCPAFELWFGARGSAIAGTCNMGYGRGLAFGDGRVWTDGGQRVLRFSADGDCEDDWGSFGAGLNQFKGNTSVRVTGDGDPSTTSDTRVYTDSFNCLIQEFTWNGQLLDHMGGTCGTSTIDQMSQPRQLDVVGDRVYVADQLRSRIAVWDWSTHSVVSEIKGMFGSVNLLRPEGVVYDAASGWLYIADTGHARLVRCHLDGSSREVVSVDWGTSGGFFTQPRYLEVAQVGQYHLLFVNDSRRNYVFKV